MEHAHVECLLYMRNSHIGSHCGCKEAKASKTNTFHSLVFIAMELVKFL